MSQIEDGEDLTKEKRMFALNVADVVWQINKGSFADIQGSFCSQGLFCIIQYNKNQKMKMK